MIPIVIGLGIGAALILSSCSRKEDTPSTPNPVPSPPESIPVPVPDNVDTYQFRDVYREVPPTLQRIAHRLLQEGVAGNVLDRGERVFFPWQGFQDSELTLVRAGDHVLSSAEIAFGAYRAYQDNPHHPVIQQIFRELMGNPSNRLAIAVQLMLIPEASAQDRDVARGILVELVQHFPNESIYRENLGHRERLQGNKVEALRQYVLADEIGWLSTGVDSPALGLLEEMREAREDSQAEALLREVLTHNYLPEYPCTLHYLGRLQEMRGRNREAIRSYRRVLEYRNPSDPRYVFENTCRRLISLLVEAGRYRDAARIFHRLEDKGPEDYLRQALILERLGRSAEAEEMRRQGEELGNPFPATRSNADVMPY